MAVTFETILAIFRNTTNVHSACRKVCDDLASLGFSSSGCHVFETVGSNRYFLVAGFGHPFAGAQSWFNNRQALLEVANTHENRGSAFTCEIQLADGREALAVIVLGGKPPVL
jgi:hypothetical protein